jgi:outer membrane lipoprotein-sorting protein
MKKLFLAVTCLLAVAVLNAQSLEEIVKKYSEANKLDKISSLKTIKLTGSMSMMGQEFTFERLMKSPDKIKIVTNVMGQQAVQAFDGEKGYMINPVMGSTDPVEMGPEQLDQTKRDNTFQNPILNNLKDGKLSLVGEESVNGNPSFKIKGAAEGVKSLYMFIDKSSYLLTKMTMEVEQQGQLATVDMFFSDFKDTNGVYLPMKTTISSQGMEFGITYTNVEVNIPMEDSIFKLK